jgi:flagellar motility protein MotE (MotC chaperone)
MRKSKQREAAEYFSKMGRKARSAQLAKMTPEARSEMMRKVARARWDKKKSETDRGAGVSLEGAAGPEIAAQAT